MHNTKEIQDWLSTHIAKLLQIAPEAIDIHESFSAYGLSSLDVVTLSGDLQEFLGHRLSPTVAYDYPNILSLSLYLAGNPGNQQLAQSLDNPAEEAIAVIGMGCRFPGAKNPESFWQLLREGVDAISDVPGDRWKKEAFYSSDPSVPGKSISYWGGFLDNVDQFDPFFFGISPVEAKHMDPQQRLLLELSYEALDDAGLTIEKMNGTKTGVFIGISVNEYSQLQFADPMLISSHSGTGAALSIAANRISYFYNFHGPSIAIDTACSSSLSAVHLACKSLRNRECTMALAGGVNMILSPAHSIAFTKSGVLAPDGRCKTFDAAANGYVRGEGGGLIMLKLLSSALGDADPIHALILGSAMCQDGRTNGLIAPSREAQETLLREAYRSAGVLPGSIQYVEAHGTGTLLGDSIEAQALGAVIGLHRKNGPCAIGSVKTNIGHLESAAGIAGLIKIILSLKHRAIPPSIHYQTPNPHIPFDELHIRVNNRLTPWSSSSGALLAGVSSFGFGGTNVHVVMREADHVVQKTKENEHFQSNDSGCQLLPLSANSYEDLQSLAHDMKKLIVNDTAVCLKDICYAASTRRSHQYYRMAVIGNSPEDFYTSLHAYLTGSNDPNLLVAREVPKRKPKLVFVFPGQGGQWYGMGRELLRQEPEFYDAIKRIDHLIQAQYGWSLMKKFQTEDTESVFDKIDVVQPVLFAIQVALARLWQSWGITPEAVIGHSMGEVAAAHIAGILSLEDAVNIICCRSQLLKCLRGHGSMLLTDFSMNEARQWINDKDINISIAAINSPVSTVLSGSAETVKGVMESLQGQNRFCKLINVDVASHSPQMDQLRGELQSGLNTLDPRPSRIPIYSTVTGSRGDNLLFNADYWMDNLRQPVLFSNAISELLETGHSAFIEISPHPVLLSSIQQTVQSHHREVKLLPSMRREEPVRQTLLGTLGILYTLGFSIIWSRLYPTGARHVHLPPIAWHRQRYWMETRLTNSKNAWHNPERNHPLLGQRLELANTPFSFVWQADFDEGTFNFLKDHRVENEIVFPAAAYIEMALRAAVETGLYYSHMICDFAFKERMILNNGKTTTTQTLLFPGEGGSYLFSVYSRMSPEEEWALHASATLRENQAADDLSASMKNTPGSIRQQGASHFASEEFYSNLRSFGIQYGPGFQTVKQIWVKDYEALGHISLPEALHFNSNNYQVHPALLDGCLQVLAAAIQNISFGDNFYLPLGCDRIQVFSQPNGMVLSYVSLKFDPDSNTDTIIADVRILNCNDQVIAELTGFTLQRISRRILQLPSGDETWLYHLKWQLHSHPGISPFAIEPGKHWLILADNTGLGEALASQLEAAGNHYHLIHFNEAIKHFENIPGDFFIKLIEERLKDISVPLYGIIHLWSVSTAQSSGSHARPRALQTCGCNSVLSLVQAMAKSMFGFPRLWLVTRGSQPVQTGETVAVEQSTLWGLGKVISFEFPEFKCTRIDLESQQTVLETISPLVKQLLKDDPEDQIAFRGGARFVPRLLPFTFKGSSTSCSPFRSDSSYLITGGLGGLGLKTAEWMAKRGARHFVLLGRNKPSHLANSVVAQLREKGIEVIIARADVSDPTQLQYELDKIKKHMPVLRGIFHAAGVLDDGSLLNLNAERMKKVMAPKVDGTWNLHKATLDLPLDFFVLFSSAVSVLGSPGQGNYAAASAYLDAFAYYRRSRGLPAMSINWGPWAEVGLAAETTERLKDQNASTQHLIKVIKIEQGLAILEQLLMESPTQVMALPFDLKNLIELYSAAATIPFLSEIGRSETHVAQLYARPKLRQQYAAPRNEIERKIAQLWQQTLHIDLVGIHDSFFELGGDSVLAAQVLTLAQKTYGIRISTQEAFKAFTIEGLAAMLETEILRKIEEMSEEEALGLLEKDN